MAEKSPVGMAGVVPGDLLETINGYPIRDIIDYRFYSADEVLNCTFSRNGLSRQVTIQRDDEDLGVDFEPMRYCSCGNQCIFCFVDQNPMGMRPSLYFKDEDYRLSFLHGNYVTLTHAGSHDLERIVTQRLSPLYISIHATNLEVRKTLLNLREDDHLLDKIRYLTERGIELHGQIVLCPGINDGEVLDTSLETLSMFYPKLRSMAVVPVGLTRHRQGLPQLKGYDAVSARAVIQNVGKHQNRSLRKDKESWVYLADEFYLLAGCDIPPAEHYGDYWQVENGVGMIRSFLTEFEESSKRFPKQLKKTKRYTFVTGVLAGPMLEKVVLPMLSRIKNMDVRLKVVSNSFYGETVTVSGLLTGGDIIRALQGDGDTSTVLLPPNCLNDDGLFLDDRTPEDLTGVLGRHVRILNHFDELFMKQGEN